MELKLFETDVAIKKVITKMESSLEDFENNTPHRTDIIESMKQSIEDLYTIKYTYEYLKTYFKTNDMVQFLQIEEIEKLKVQNQKLEDQLEKIKSNLEL